MSEQQIENRSKTPEQIHAEDLKRIEDFCPLHDTFARSLFKKNLPLAQLVLRIMTGINDLVLTEEYTQYDIKRLTGARSVCLDVYGGDSSGRKYNLELERSEEGAAPERAEYHITAMNTEHLSKSQEFTELPETYVIFLTEKDQIGDGAAVHFFSYRDDKTNESFGGKTHILYVNGAYKDDKTDIGRLMHDFRCNKADEMYYEEMASRTRYLKETEEGRKEMCAIMDDLRKESERQGEIKKSIAVAKNLIARGRDTIEEIAELTGLPVEQVQELVGKRTA